MLDHLSLQCDDLTASRQFYETVLAPLRDPDSNNVEVVSHS